MVTFTFLSCATSSKNFKPESINKDKEGVFFGKIKIIMDGDIVTSNCYFQTWDENEERAHVNITESGLVVGKLGKGKNHLKALFCRNGMTHHNFTFKDDSIYFLNVGNGISSYFGDLSIYWSSGSFNPLVFLLGAGAAGAIGPEVKQIVFTQSDNLTSTREEVEELLHVEIDAKSSIFQFPKGRLISEEQGKKLEKRMLKGDHR